MNSEEKLSVSTIWRFQSNSSKKSAFLFSTMFAHRLYKILGSISSCGIMDEIMDVFVDSLLLALLSYTFHHSSVNFCSSTKCLDSLKWYFNRKYCPRTCFYRKNWLSCYRKYVSKIEETRKVWKNLVIFCILIITLKNE
jgi:hypothetical protein